MSAKRTIEALLHGACEAADELGPARACPEHSRRERQVLRLAWVKGIMAKHVLSASKGSGRPIKPWTRHGIGGSTRWRMKESTPTRSKTHRLFPNRKRSTPFLAQANAVRDHGPKELYWGGI